MNYLTPKIYKADHKKLEENLPHYTVSDGYLYRTVYHSLGWSNSPDYLIGKDRKVYRTEFHPEG